MFKNFKEKQAVKAKARKEAEGIFMKLNPNMADKNGNFPKVDAINENSAYGKEARRTEKQVVKTRVDQWKASKERGRLKNMSEAGTPFNRKMWRQIEKEEKGELKKAKKLVK